jgi:hypothetical protein
MSYVYFLGAGFSAAYGLPVMNDFFRFARNNKLITTNEKKFLAEVQRFAHMGVRLVTISRNNMEEILSFLEMAEQAGQIPPQLTDLSKLSNKAVSPLELLRSIIARVYGPLDASHLNSFSIRDAIVKLIWGEIGRSYSSMGVKVLKTDKLDDATFITTNYDLCLETHLLQIYPGHKLHLVGDWISAEGHDQGNGDTSGIYDNKSHAKLIRLHGAVNWNSPGYSLNDRTYKFRVNSNVDTQHKNVPWAITLGFYKKNSTAPIIVAPTVFKHQADGPYAEQWSEAAKALASATQLVFIGYSFPESDAYMRYFLGASLAENVDIEAIHIIDPNADAIVQRLKDCGHYGAHFLDLLRPYNRCWHKN